MADVPPWERLSDAIARVMAEAGLSRDEAQTRICRAIADGAVKIRGKLGRHTTTGFRASNTVLEERDFHIAPEIKPEHLDWEQSRPVKPWVVRREAFRELENHARNGACLSRAGHDSLRDERHAPTR
jgi:hypothetical protein